MFKRLFTTWLVALALVLAPTIGLPWLPASSSGRAEAAVASSAINVQMYGTAGNGTTNDRPALAAAIAAFGSNAGDLLIPAGTYLISTSLTVPSNVRLVGQGGVIKMAAGATLTDNGSVLVSQRQLFAYTSLTAAPVVFGVGAVSDVSPRWFGAVGDGTTDDTGAIQAAQSASLASGAVISFPPGVFKISAPLLFTVPMRGSGRTATTIKATSDFIGSRMLDFNSGTADKKFVSDLGWDASSVAGLQIFGSSSSGGAGGSSASTFTNLWFKNTVAGLYSVGGTSSITEPGMLTGATFINCSWDGCSSWFRAGNNQDDVTLIGCRFAANGATPTTFVMSFSGSDINLIGCYFSVGNSSFTTSGITPLVFIGSYPIRFSGSFFEGTTNANYLFYAGSPSSVFRLENTALNLTAASMVALIRTQITDTSSNFTHDVHNVEQPTGLSFPIWDIFASGVRTANITCRFSGIDTLGVPFQFGSGSSGTDNPAGDVRLFGTYQGLEYHNAFARSQGSTIAKSIPLGADGRYGMYSYEAIATTASAASPAVQTFTLPGAGVWLVTVTAKVTGSKDHMMSSSYLAYFYHATNDTLDTDQIGGLHKSAGSSFGLSSLSTSGPSTTGVLTYSAAWTDGASHAVTWAFTARKVQSFDGPWTVN